MNARVTAACFELLNATDRKRGREGPRIGCIYCCGENPTVHSAQLTKVLADVFWKTFMMWLFF